MAEENEQERREIMTKERSMRIQSEKKFLLHPEDGELQEWIRKRQREEEDDFPDYTEAAQCLRESELVNAYKALAGQTKERELTEDEAARIAALDGERARRKEIYESTLSLSPEELALKEEEIQEALQNENEDLSPSEKQMLEAEAEQVQNAEKERLQKDKEQQNQLQEQEEQEEKDEEQERDKEEKEIEDEEDPEKKEELEERREYKRALTIGLLMNAAERTPEEMQGVLARLEHIQGQSPEERDKARASLEDQLNPDSPNYAFDPDQQKWLQGEKLLYDIADAEENRGPGFAKWKQEQQAEREQQNAEQQQAERSFSSGYQRQRRDAETAREQAAEPGQRKQDGYQAAMQKARSETNLRYTPVTRSGDLAARQAKEEGKGFLEQEGARITAEAMAVRSNFNLLRGAKEKSSKEHVRFFGRVRERIHEVRAARRNANIEKGRMYLEMMMPPEEACIHLKPLSEEQLAFANLYNEQKASRKRKAMNWARTGKFDDPEAERLEEKRRAVAELLTAKQNVSRDDPDVTRETGPDEPDTISKEQLAEPEKQERSGKWEAAERTEAKQTGPEKQPDPKNPSGKTSERAKGRQSGWTPDPGYAGYSKQEIAAAQRYGKVSAKDFQKMVSVMPERSFEMLRENAELLHVNKLDPDSPAHLYLDDPDKLRAIQEENRNRDIEVDVLSSAHDPEDLREMAHDCRVRQGKLDLSNPQNARKAARLERESDVYQMAETMANVKNTPTDELVASYATSIRSLQGLREMGGPGAEKEAGRLVKQIRPMQKQLLERGKSPYMEAKNYWNRSQQRHAAPAQKKARTPRQPVK